VLARTKVRQVSKSSFEVPRFNAIGRTGGADTTIDRLSDGDSWRTAALRSNGALAERHVVLDGEDITADDLRWNDDRRRAYGCELE